jgi:heme/copper-type cytochrome/quinol oxidase subunit 3
MQNNSTITGSSLNWKCKLEALRKGKKKVLRNTSTFTSRLGGGFSLGKGLDFFHYYYSFIDYCHHHDYLA